MRIFFSLLLIVLLCTCALAQRMLPTAAVPAMVDSLHAAIVAHHPFAFTTEGVAALAEARTRVQGKVQEVVGGRDSLAYHEFINLAAPLQAVTGCGHLMLVPIGDTAAWKEIVTNRYDLSLVPVSDREEYVLRRDVVRGRDTLFAGTPIRSLNGLKVHRLTRMLAPFAGDNDAGYNYASEVKIARKLSRKYQSYFGLQDSLLVETGDGEVLSIFPRRGRIAYADEDYFHIESILKFQVREDQSAAILKVKSFKRYKFFNGGYEQFFRAAVDSLLRYDIPRLIVDLRDNGGGKIGNAAALFRLLAEDKFQLAAAVSYTSPAHSAAGESGKRLRRRRQGAITARELRNQRTFTRWRKPSKRRYTGGVIVLIDEGTFSASGMFARLVQGSGRGVLVGSTAGAGTEVTYAGHLRQFPFIGPQDDFRLHVNTIRMEMPYAKAGNVTPDVAVRPTAADLRAGNDRVLATALGLKLPLKE